LLNVSVALKQMEMGKNADESACGTTNSIDPLTNILSQTKQVQKFNIIVNTACQLFKKSPKL